MNSKDNLEHPSGNPGSEADSGSYDPQEVADIDLPFEDIDDPAYNKLEPLVESGNEERNRKLINKVVATTADYISQEDFGMSVEVPSRIKVVSSEEENFTITLPSGSDEVEISTEGVSKGYIPAIDTLFFNSYRDAIQGSTCYHELMHQYHVRRHIGSFESADDPLAALEDLRDITNPDLKNDLLRDLQLENNEGYEKYVLLLTLRRSDKLPQLLEEANNYQERVFQSSERVITPDKEAKESISERDKMRKEMAESRKQVSQEFYKIVDEYGLDEVPVEPTSEALADFSKLYFINFIDNPWAREVYIDKRSRARDLGLKYDEAADKLLERYDALPGTSEEKFKQVMREQGDLFEMAAS